ncbi:hypothetical protein EGR_11321 [Echinococcus granulosus]|uniref:Uncharacterized protein n=1 Tax=Echinococcus granulosus TaxID=6210 RepID=W6TYM7_ECHGR|nr:hypothetical protein EGR_11321 [Echinococcus granulosus]EUB53828.1 hypothetical protein EGR_11321 [Echinococcus granulosus]
MYGGRVEEFLINKMLYCITLALHSGDKGQQFEDGGRLFNTANNREPSEISCDGAVSGASIKIFTPSSYWPYVYQQL